MLTDLFQSLCDHLSGLDIPIYLADCVPPGARLPYFTADIKAPMAGTGAGLLTLTCWCHGDQANTERLSLADDLLLLLPARGIYLPTMTGRVILRQELPAGCVREESLLGLKTMWKLRFLPAL